MSEDWERIDVGAPDAELLARARTVAEMYEPLVVDSAFDDPLDPWELRLHLGAGIEADSGRFEVTWTDRLRYRYHYTEGEAFNYRYDFHPRTDVQDRHFHEPPCAARGSLRSPLAIPRFSRFQRSNRAAHDAVPSCIAVETVRLVTLAVLQLWRDTVESGDIARLQQVDPP